MVISTKRVSKINKTFFKTASQPKLFIIKFFIIINQAKAIQEKQNVVFYIKYLKIQIEQISKTIYRVLGKP